MIAGPLQHDMKRRSLGSQGPQINVLGLGSWAVGGRWTSGIGSRRDGDSVAAIRAAVDAGITWVDTAAAYGRGHAERVVATALTPYRVGEDVLVFTKGGQLPSAVPGAADRNDLRPSTIRAECEASLRRLRVERLDLYQLHWPDDSTGTAVEDSWGTLGDLISEGKVRWAGLSNLAVADLRRCEAIRHVDSLQLPLSLITPEARDALEWCAAHGTAVLGYSPMATGLLSGVFDRSGRDRLEPGDWRRGAPNFQEPRFSQVLDLVDDLRPVAERLGATVGQVAIAWALSQPGVTGCIVGARTPDQVRGWLPAARLALPEEIARRPPLVPPG